MSYKLSIGWLYPELMSTYGDRGNIIVLTKRCEWRGVSVEVIAIDQETTPEKLSTIDLFFAGGAQDREQAIVMLDLKKKKAEVLRKRIESGIPALFVCGAPQLMGNFYEPALGERIEGVGIFDIETKHPGEHAKRLIGNIVAEIHWENLIHDTRYQIPDTKYLVGFENHGGRTMLGQNAKPLASVVVGFGNNGEDKTEGVVYKNTIGTYSHGSLLPKNPMLADYLIKKTLEVKYEKEISLKILDDALEERAREAILKKLGVI